MNKLSKSLFVATSIFASCSVQARPVTPLSTTTVTEINNQVSGVNFTNLERVINDANFVNNTTIKPNNIPKFSTVTIPGFTSGSFSFPGTSFQRRNGSYYPLSNLSGTLNGHNVQVYTTGGTALGRLGNLKLVDATTGGRVTKNTQQVSIQGLTSDTVIVTVDGVEMLNSSRVMSRADAIDVARVLEILPGLEVATSSSLASTSPSSASSQLAYNALNRIVLSHKERLADAARPRDGINVAVADLKYEQAQFTNSKEDGDIKGVLMALSTEIAGVEIGAYIPYDYLNFESFSAHRTGTMLYAKRDWNLPHNLQLTTMANFNYMATYVSRFSLTHTFGGGFGTSLTFDDGGNFVPRVSFSLQYNQDDYYKANDYIKDNHQLLAKTGASLGYRLFDNATLQVGFSYTHDLTDYKSTYNKIKDNDYFDITVGGSYAIADMWQVNLSYKRILGLDSYYSNTVFLGTTVGF